MSLLPGEVGEAVWDRLHDAGLRVTPLRRRLVGLFADLHHWVTPQELYAAAADAGLDPGLATIYRLIEALTAAGLCKAYPQTNRTVRYVFCPPMHHHHLICEVCGYVVNLTECRIDAPDLPFQVRGHVVDFFGVCPECEPAQRPE